jgi:predicted metalloprotease with PDZ domain
VVPYKDWANVATGLDDVPGKKFTYAAADFDVLFDSPLLIGNLETLPAFTVKGIPHYFTGYKLGDFDRDAFMKDLKKIVEGGAAIIGDIPYKHYTFLGIGPGRGGIEHLNSSSLSFEGSQLNSTEGKVRMLSFIAHEYFHHYNVKRIRPIELGPFDYDSGSKTKLLWVSEGLTVYYEYLILKRSGLMTEQELFNAFRNNLSAYENKPGHMYQSVAQASYETWSDGPFGRTGDEVNKTISYYDKGPVLGMLLDFKIRHETKNRWMM